MVVGEENLSQQMDRQKSFFTRRTSFVGRYTALSRKALPKYREKLTVPLPPAPVVAGNGLLWWMAGEAGVVWTASSF